MPLGSFAWPVDGQVLRGFEESTGPYGEGGHQGVDIAAESGTEVGSAADGRVEYVGELPRGRFVSVSHAGGVRTTYLDLERVDVARGERVARGQPIATVSGRRDNSSPQPHLHFGAYLNGTPVDPGLLMSGLTAESFIRLCPVERPSGSGRASALEGDDTGGFWQSIGRGLKWAFSGVTRPAAWLWRGLKSGVSAVWNGAAKLWSRYIFPALASAGRAVAGAVRWIWSNRWVKAVVAGIAAALVVIAVIALAVFTFGLSLVAATVAAVAASIAAIGYSLYYAATHAVNFSFLSCFAGSLSAGGVAAGLAVSVVSLAGAFSAGWAQLGLWGATKAALWNGSLSALFEAGTSYVSTGHLSIKSLLVAFAVGALSGAVGKTLSRGLRTSLAAEALSPVASAPRSRIVAWGRSLLLAFRERAARAFGLLSLAKDPVISIGTKVAYLGYSGTFGVTLNAVLCSLTGKPMTVSGTLASFFTGVTMGAVALSYGVQGISGILAKFKVFREGLGRAFKGLIAKIIGKSVNKGLNLGFKNLFKRLLGEEVQR
jgi:hypothetical protein